MVSHLKRPGYDSDPAARPAPASAEFPIARIDSSTPGAIVIDPARRGRILQAYDNQRYATKLVTLGNGLPVAVSSFPQLEVVGIAVSIRYGALDDEASKAGAAHLLEHNVGFKGTTKRTVEDFRQRIGEIGADANASTYPECTTFTIKVDKKYMKEGAELIADMIRNATIPANELKLEKGPVINELHERHREPQAVVEDSMTAVLYREPKLQGVGADNSQTTNNITRDELFKVYQTYYTPQNMVMAISGAVTNRGAIKLAEDTMASFQRPYAPISRINPDNTQEARELVVERLGLEQSAIGMGFKFGGMAAKGIEGLQPIRIAKTILQDRLWNEIRDKRGLTYKAQAHLEIGTTIGYGFTFAESEPKDAAEVRSVMLREIERMEHGEVGKEEFEQARHLRASEAREMRADPEAHADKIATLGISLLNPRIPEITPRLLDAVTLDDLRASCAKYLRSDKLGIVTVTPKSGP